MNKQKGGVWQTPETAKKKGNLIREMPSDRWRNYQEREAISWPHNRRNKSGKSELPREEENSSLLGWEAGWSLDSAEKIVRAKRDKNTAKSRTERSG